MMQPLMTSTSSVEAPADAMRSLNLLGFSFFMPESAYDFPCGLPVAYSFSNAVSATGCGCERTNLKSISPFDVTPAYPTPPNANILAVDKRFTASSRGSSASAATAHRSSKTATQRFTALKRSILCPQYNALAAWRHARIVQRVVLPQSAQSSSENQNDSVPSVPPW
jgi:hypothetical protein